MRILSLAVLVAFAAVVAVFALQNEHDITVVFFGVPVAASVRLIVAGAVLLGMLSGWAVVGLLRRSAARLLDDDRKR